VAGFRLKERVVFEAPERRRAIIEVVESARTRLALSVYRLDDAAVWTALLGASRRGVAIEVLVTPRAKGGRRALTDLMNRMERAGFAVRRYPETSVKYHAKYLIADDRVGVVASLNLTRRCFNQTCDFLVVTECREVLDGLIRLFETDYRGAARTRADFGGRLVVAPEMARTWYAAVIPTARRRLRLIDHKLSDPGMLQLIRHRVRAGVSVEILDRGGMDPARPHGKLLIVDDRVAVLGSIALAPRHLDRRRELAIVVRNRRAVSELGSYFDRLARGSRRSETDSGQPIWTSCEAP
jgi:phosphatidylserine/phosphatidylglycerophosphate/cardiolipin synthase-like enzyme